MFSKIFKKWNFLEKLAHFQFSTFTYFSPCIFINSNTIASFCSIFSFWNKSTVHMRECGDSPHCVNFSSMLLGFKKASKTWLFVVQRVQCLWNSIIIIFRPLSCDMQKFKNLIVGSTSMQFSMIWFAMYVHSLIIHIH